MWHHPLRGPRHWGTIGGGTSQSRQEKGGQKVRREGEVTDSGADHFENGPTRNRWRWSWIRLWARFSAATGMFSRSGHVQRRRFHQGPADDLPFIDPPDRRA